MRLAEPEIAVSVGGSNLQLRPTLRAACRLERRYNGFEQIARGVADGTLSVVADIILEGCPTCDLNRAALEFALTTPLTRLQAIIPDLLSFVMALCGIDETTGDNPNTTPGEPISFADYHAKLYRLGTGWLGWTPNDTWDSTPAEILEAFKGRTEMLAAIFGTKNKDGETASDPIDNSPLDSAGLQALKGLARLA